MAMLTVSKERCNNLPLGILENFNIPEKWSRARPANKTEDKSGRRL